MSLHERAMGINHKDWAAIRDLLCDIAHQVDKLAASSGRSKPGAEASESLPGTGSASAPGEPPPDHAEQ